MSTHLFFKLTLHTRGTRLSVFIGVEVYAVETWIFEALV